MGGLSDYYQYGGTGLNLENCYLKINFDLKKHFIKGFFLGI